MDLDETIISAHRVTKDICILGTKELKEVHLSDNSKYIMFIRPGTEEFLRDLSPLYDIYVCTFSTKEYALKVIKKLDQASQYLQKEVFTRQDCQLHPPSKLPVLNRLLPLNNPLAMIVDDNISMWQVDGALAYPEKTIEAKPFLRFEEEALVQIHGSWYRANRGNDDYLSSLGVYLKKNHTKFYESMY